VTRSSNSTRKKTIQARGFQKYFDGAIESKGAFDDRWKSGRIIGSSRYWNLDVAHSEVEMDGLSGRAFWGGANGELKSSILAHAFRYVDRVVFVVGKNNLARRALEKIGATFSGSATKCLRRPETLINPFVVTLVSGACRTAARAFAQSSARRLVRNVPNKGRTQSPSAARSFRQPCTR
jgi:hypothetical protein